MFWIVGCFDRIVICAAEVNAHLFNLFRTDVGLNNKERTATISGRVGQPTEDHLSLRLTDCLENHSSQWYKTVSSTLNMHISCKWKKSAYLPIHELFMPIHRLLHVDIPKDVYFKDGQKFGIQNDCGKRPERLRINVNPQKA